MNRNGSLNCIIKLAGNFILASIMLQAKVLEGSELSAIYWGTCLFLKYRWISANKLV